MIHANDKIIDILTRHPQIERILMMRNAKYHNLTNPVAFNRIGKYSRISEVAKVGGEDLDVMLDDLNAMLASKSS